MYKPIDPDGKACAWSLSDACERAMKSGELKWR
jgi:hypothetical protein